MTPAPETAPERGVGEQHEAIKRAAWAFEDCANKLAKCAEIGGNAKFAIDALMDKYAPHIRALNELSAALAKAGAR
jgi:hypothetical protein